MICMAFVLHQLTPPRLTGVLSHQKVPLTYSSNESIDNLYNQN